MALKRVQLNLHITPKQYRMVCELRQRIAKLRLLDSHVTLVDMAMEAFDLLADRVAREEAKAQQKVG